MRGARVRTRRPAHAITVVGLATTMLVSGWAATTAAAGSSQSQDPQWPVQPGWERYVMAPANSDVTPMRVVRTSGSVTGAKALTDPGGKGGATLTKTSKGPSPAIVVDYGKDVGGVPYFVVRSVSGTPVLSSIYSEGSQYLGPSGDQSPSASPAGDPSRVDDLTVGSAGELTTGLIQGGERYERITLATPGTVTLSSIGIDFTAVRATAGDFRGWFDSSSSELDRIWYDGAYTTQLNELPADGVPASWRITAGTLEAVGRSAGVLHRGLGWTDYSMSFDTRVLDSSTGWLVRASSPTSGYLFILSEATGDARSPDTLQEFAVGPGEFDVIGDVALPETIVAGRWHHVTTVASGTDITTSIDGRQVATFDTSAIPSGASVYGSGTVGFETMGSTALFRDLDVTGQGGQRLYANDLSRSSALADFPGPQVTAPDSLPVIMDGARRDRVVWSGDLGVEVPNVFYTTGAASFVRGSLQLLGSYQTADGESGTNVNPTVPLGTSLQSGATYSASYSMDEVDNIATYYLYTGDLSFVRSEWPMITRELAYNASLVDGRGLLVTNGDDGRTGTTTTGARPARSPPTTTSTTRRSRRRVHGGRPRPPWRGLRLPARGRGSPDGHQPVSLRSVDGALRLVQSPARSRGPGRQLPGRALRCRPGRTRTPRSWPPWRRHCPRPRYGPESFTHQRRLPGRGQPVRHRRGGPGALRQRRHRGRHVAGADPVGLHGRPRTRLQRGRLGARRCRRVARASGPPRAWPTAGRAAPRPTSPPTSSGSFRRRPVSGPGR